MNKNGGPLLYDTINCICYPFDLYKEFSIGRSPDSSLDISSKFISRNQCLIKCIEEKEWSIKDFSSFKSTRVNSKPIKTEWQVLKNGDRITFSNYEGGEYVFYKDSASLPKSKKRKLVEPVINIDEDDDSNESTPSSGEIEQLKEKNSGLLAEVQRLSEENKVLNDRCQQISTILVQTQKSLEDLETEKTNIALKLMDEQTTKERLVLQMQNYIDSLKECEMELERVIEEKNSLRKELTEKEMTSNDNKSSHISVEFNTMKEEIEKIHKELLAKDGRINEILAEKDILSSNVSDLLEQEFTCSVCSDVLFQATSLECRHTFCATCVATWKLKKKECPVCRTRIKAEVMPLVIDAFIDKITDLIGGEFKKRRDDIRLERANKPTASYRSPQTARRGQRRNSRGASRQSNRRQQSNMVLLPREYEIVVTHLQRFLDTNEPIDLTSSPGGS